ncbi:MAG TPA: WbqC family protein, partial [Saprospiraceae bacterium]|nr:WbqC family protein [Saprospiraceae bacterium]
NEKSLFQYNKNIILEICNMLKIPITIEHTTDFEKNAETSFYNKIKLNNPMDTIPYYQVYEKENQFLNNLSILDLIFHMGPESILYLRKMLEQTD